MTGTNLQRRPRLESRWGHHAARAWGDCERRIHLGGRVFPDGGMIVDGWPPTSPSAQWREGDGGSHRRHVQKVAEVYDTPEALVVSRAVATMPATMRGVLWLVYVEGRGVAKRVRDDSGLARDRFYILLGCALDLIEAGQDNLSG